jgi:4-hydroxy-3-polyprenylbenzoate decarboxylase
MHWQMHHQGAHHHRLNEAAGRRTEVAVALGGDPATTYSAIAPLPDDIDEMMFAGFLRRKPVELVPCKTVDLEVPANAEIVLEGYCEPGETCTEGPFGDHTGFYTPEETHPVFHVQCVTHRRDPIYPATIVGIPPQEDCHMGRGIERIFLPLVRKQLPEIVDMHLPWAGVFHNLVIISIRKRWPGHARKIMSAIWGLGQMMFSKVIVVVDDDTDVHDMGQVAWRVLNNIDPERDMQFTMGPIDVLDHASRLLGYGSKVGIDGTKKWPGEGYDRVWPEQVSMDEKTRALVDARWKDYGID